MQSENRLKTCFFVDVLADNRMGKRTGWLSEPRTQRKKRETSVGGGRERKKNSKAALSFPSLHASSSAGSAPGIGSAGSAGRSTLAEAAAASSE